MAIQTPEKRFGYSLQMTFQWEKLVKAVQAKLTEDHTTKHMRIHWSSNAQLFSFPCLIT